MDDISPGTLIFGAILFGLVMFVVKRLTDHGYREGYKAGYEMGQRDIQNSPELEKSIKDRG